jgi:hypothetical protein
MDVALPYCIVSIREVEDISVHMSGLEIPGLVVGVAGVLVAFKGAIDTALLIEAFFDDARADCGCLALSYHIEQTRLQLWGELCKANDES